MTRLRPVRADRPGKPAAPQPPVPPSPAALHNPYSRYYTAPRSFEQLVRQQRGKPKP